MNAAQIIYDIDGTQKKFGDTKGVCVFTGKEAEGTPVKKALSSNFTDYEYLGEGSIISHPFMFTMQNRSTYIQKLTGRDKPQNFRTYTHMVVGNEWHMYTKANKPEIFKALVHPDLRVAVIAESGQKNLVFKHQLGKWQLEETHIQKDVPRLKLIHDLMCELYALGFSQSEIILGNYDIGRIGKLGLENFLPLENQLKPHRGAPIFDLAAFVIYKKEGVESFWDKPKKEKKKPNQLSIF